MTYYLLAEGRDEEQLAELDDRIYRPLEEDRANAASATALAAMNLPFTVVSS